MSDIVERVLSSADPGVGPGPGSRHKLHLLARVDGPILLPSQYQFEINF
jgi:hypothetical protein